LSIDCFRNIVFDLSFHRNIIPGVVYNYKKANVMGMMVVCYKVLFGAVALPPIRMPENITRPV